MAAITGITGSASWAGSGILSHLTDTGLLPVSFDLSAPIASFDTTGFSVTQEADMTAGLPSWSGTITGQLQTPSIGTAASVTIPSGYSTNASAWTLNIARAIHDVTDFAAAANGWMTFIGGIVSGSGTYSGFYDATTAAVDPGTIASAVFTVDGERTFTANIINGYQITSSPAAPNTIGYNFVTDGAITANTNVGGDAPVVPDGTTGTGWVEAAQTLTLTASTGQTFAGSAIWSSINIVRPASSPGIVTVGFQGTGALTPG